MITNWRNETERAAAIIGGLLAEATRVGHADARTFVSTVVETCVLQEAYAFLDEREARAVNARARPLREPGNIVQLRFADEKYGA